MKKFIVTIIPLLILLTGFLRGSCANGNNFSNLFISPVYSDSTSIGDLIREIPAAHSHRLAEIYQQLQSHEKSTFLSSDLNALEALASQIKTNKIDYIKLCGFLDLDSVLYDQQNQVSKTSGQKKLKMNLNLALVRIGDQDKLKNLLKNIEALPVNDEFIYAVLSSLIYTKQKSVYDYLLKEIMLDEKNCSTANPEQSGRIICAYRLMEMIAPEIKDFPLETDQWGDLKTDNYPYALEEVRKWIVKNRNNYQIRTDTY